MRKKVLRIIVVFMLMCLFVVNNALAMTVESLWGDSSLQSINKGISTSVSGGGIIGGINTVIGLIQVVGTGVLVIMISVLGIKYMLASVEEKAEIKKMAIPIVIGAILVFGAINIIAAVEEFGGFLNS